MPEKSTELYVPAAVSSVTISFTSIAFRKTYRNILDLTQHPLAGWKKHTDGHYCINRIAMHVDQQVTDETILSVNLDLDLVYLDGTFTINVATVNHATCNPVDNWIYATYEPIRDAIIESINVDNKHILFTGCKHP